MKSFKSYLILLFCLIVPVTSCQNTTNEKQTSDAPVLSGPYLGMTPPGDVPELFAPGIVGSLYGEHSTCAFTPDGMEVFWSRIINVRQDPRIVVVMHMQQKNGVWSKPEIAPFNHGFYNFVDSVSADGKQLYFGSSRPTEPNGEMPASSQEWVADKTEGGWGKPRLLSSDLPWDGSNRNFQKTLSGNVYFMDDLEDVERKLGLFCSKLVNGVYQEPEAVGTNINSEYLDYAYHVAPNEDFVLFASNRPGAYNGVDLYISYRQPDESWRPAINLGPEINSTGDNGTDWPQLSPDGKYLFFLTSTRKFGSMDVENYTLEKLKDIYEKQTNGLSKIYWVSTSFVEKLRPKGMTNE